MLGLYLVPLLAVTMLFIPLDGQNEDDIADPEDPTDPVNGDIIDGTGAGETITATGADTVNAGDGDDTLLADADSDGAILNGQGGADVLTLEGANGTANGGVGQDTLVSFDQINAVLNGGDGDDTIRIDGARPGTGGTASGGGGEDTIIAAGEGITVLGGAGNDDIYTQGNLDGASGGVGNDTIVSDILDYAGGTPVQGDDGDDLLVLTESAGYGVVQQADGGAGNDTIISERVFGSETVDILTGGTGEDDFEVRFLGGPNDPSSGADLGQLIEITDFDAEADTLMVDLSQFPVFATQIDAQNAADVRIVDRADYSGSDLFFTISNADADGDLTGSIGLAGVTGLSADDVSFATTPGATDGILNGATGADALTAGADETVNGGDDDFIVGETGGGTGEVIHGDEGNDAIYVEAAQAEVFGDAGADNIGVRVVLDSDAATEVGTLPGGAAADSFTINLFDAAASGGSAPADVGIVAQISDFDPAEDNLILDLRETGSQVGAISTEPAADGSYLDVTVELASLTSVPAQTFTFRLAGVTALEADQVIVREPPSVAA